MFLARISGVSEAYEQREKDIRKAEVEIVLKLIEVLDCNIFDLLEY